MAVDGTWEITINSPMGAQKAKLELVAKDGTLTGTQHAQGKSQPLSNGKADGNTVSWSANITSPMPLTLEFVGAVEGDVPSRAASRRGLSAPSPSAAQEASRLLPIHWEGWPFIAAASASAGATRIPEGEHENAYP